MGFSSLRTTEGMLIDIRGTLIAPINKKTLICPSAIPHNHTSLRFEYRVQFMAFIQIFSYRVWLSDFLQSVSRWVLWLTSVRSSISCSLIKNPPPSTTHLTKHRVICVVKQKNLWETMEINLSQKILRFCSGEVASFRQQWPRAALMRHYVELTTHTNTEIKKHWVVD